jgi:hypothetical protein
MKRYDISRKLAEWSTGILSSNDPFPASPTDSDAEDSEELITKGTNSDLTTNIPGPDGYAINKSINAKQSKITEAPTQTQEEIPTQAPAPTPSNTPQAMPPDMKAPQGMDPSMMQDPNATDTSGMYQDPSMMGMGMSGPTSTFDVGRVYELKKIYSRLVSMQSYLAGTTDPNLIKLNHYVSSSMDLFRTLISNIALYKDRLDEIIVVFYRVVDNVYSILSKYYKDKDSGKMVQAIEQSIYVRKRSIKK